MEFRTVDNSAKESLKKGFWMPLFKSRYNEKYFDKNRRREYENNLRKKLFSGGSDIVISKNYYPFNFGNGVEQYVIWINDCKKDPGIKEIVDIVEKTYPNWDYNVYVNLCEYRSIKSILHYHAILKSPSEPFHLEKLIVFHRHGNREPIFTFPAIEKIINRSYPYAKLLPVGHENSYKFGSDLKNIYGLDKKFISNSVFQTSPVFRCVETIQNIMAAMGAKNNILINKQLKPILSDEINNLSEKNIIFRTEYENILERLDDKFGFTKYPNKDRNRRMMDIYDFHSSIQCYRDMGIDMEKYIDREFENTLNIACTELYNFVSYHNQLYLQDELNDLISNTMSGNTNLVVCSTHDVLIFILVKYFACKNNISYNFGLPHYLSNIRIEKWSNGVIRIFYGNNYLGNIYE